MVGYDEYIECIRKATRVQSVKQPLHVGVDLRQGPPDVRVLGAVAVPVAIHRAEVERHEVRPRLRGQVQPGKDLVHALVAGDAVVVRKPLGGAYPVDRSLAARPEERMAGQALLFGRHPDGLALPPAAILYGLSIPEAKASQFLVVHGVGDDAVVGGVEPGGNGVVVGKRLCGEAVLHLFNKRSLGGERFEGRGIVQLKVIVAQPINRDE